VAFTLFFLLLLLPNICTIFLSLRVILSNTVVGTVPVGSFPRGVAITPDGAFAYVTNFNSNGVSVIATATDSVVATVAVGTQPVAVAITPF
jgi:YVTN family beta-propeller protein